MTTYIAGIDPGKNGGIVFMCEGKIDSLYPMPKIGSELDIFTMVKILSSFPMKNVHFYIEDVHAIFGSAAGATFSFGFVCGAIQASVSALNMPFTLVQPKVWQKVAYQGIPEIRKPDFLIKQGKRAGKSTRGKRDCKQMSELAARRLFPGVDFRSTEKCKKVHDGIVDAALIAYYGGIRDKM